MLATARPLRALVLLPALAALVACDTIGNPIDAMTSKRPSPDEFQVIARKELRRPPGLGSSTLPEPNPGAPSPLDPDPRGDAVAALTGQRVAASAPRASAVSRGEEALLAAADAQAANPEIRDQIIAENAEIAENKPYEPPTIFELLSGGPDYDPEDVVDPVAESRRLQESGVATPVDANALARQAELEAQTAEATTEPAPETTIRQPRFRPSIPLDSSFQ
ncbi:MAG: DUF3035 domain-containing protein [Pseudomonadota bacterium]